MILINEWLPNPAGADAAGEWVELFNGGQSPVSLNGWFLKNGNGKKVFLKNHSVDAGAYLVLKRNETKLTLRNNSETIFLYDNAGRLVDQSGFLGSAPDGKSFARRSFSEGGLGKNDFIFAEPTPGQVNKAVDNGNFLINNAYPAGQPLNNPVKYFDIAGLTIGLALLLAFFTIVLFKRNDYLSNLFFGRD
ncbi:MAG: lamin tail domain-containing protein [Candidatus Liptonbacteria bacterium]|nr:lamin tail domain-containing protein [Candidatus Liptonbacteria bacterium]